jgi:hypothetical protein
MNWQELMGLVATTGRQAREDVAGYFKPTTDLVNPNAIDLNVYRNIDMNPYTAQEQAQARQYGAIRKLPITNKEILGRALMGGAGLGDVIPTSAIGTGALAGMAKVFHGSPHLFKKFRTDKIGTGEGAQAYGHGLYFAENPAVAREYRDRLASGQLHNPDGSVFNPFEHLKNRNVRATLQKTDGDIQRTIARANELIESIPNTQGAEYAKKDIEVLSKLQGLKRPQSNLYKADIPDKQIAKMLDWDKPLSEQPKSVMDAVDKILPKSKRDSLAMRGLFGRDDYTKFHTGKTIAKPLAELTGKEVQVGLRSEIRSSFGSDAQNYREALGDADKFLKRVAGREKDSDRITSAVLKREGIPGIKYLDQGSRGAGQGTRNYVVFDERLPTIEEINSKVVTRKLR